MIINNKKTTISSLILVFLALQAIQVFTVKTTSQLAGTSILQGRADDYYYDSESGENYIPGGYEIGEEDRDQLVVIYDTTKIINVNVSGGGDDDDDYGQCEFSVVVDEGNPNCDNIEYLIEVTEYQLSVLQTAKQLVEDQISALVSSYQFISDTCVRGVYGIEYIIKPASLLQVSDSFVRFDEKSRQILPNTDLLEKKALKAFLGAGELLEDSAHCSQEEVKERCENYLNETNNTIAAFEKFSEDISNKTIYLTNRSEYLTIWIGENNKYCPCINPEDFNTQACCGFDQFINTTSCVCYNNFTEKRCCHLEEYTNDTRCSCYHNFSDRLCCPLKKYENTAHCQCYSNFTVDECCDLPEYKNTNINCICHNNFSAANCCSIEPYKSSDAKCTCLKVFVPKNCCSADLYPDNYRCKCEPNPNPAWEQDYCCNITRYENDTKCVCAKNFTTETCCSLDEYSSELECQCYKDFDRHKCCNLTDYIDTPICKCQNQQPFNATYCCGFEEFQTTRAECLCLNPDYFTITPCCDYSEFQNKTVCLCQNQTDPLSPYPCCTEARFIYTKECNCTRQCSPLSPQNCCDSSIFEDYTECKCFQQTDPTYPEMCCGYEPFVNDSKAQHECECYGQTNPINYTIQPLLNCCDTSFFSNSSPLCKCFKNFNSSLCCDYDEFSDYPVCACKVQDNPINSLNCCNETSWMNSAYCRCQRQNNSHSPYDCCNQTQFADDHYCLCQNQSSAIDPDSGRNCCDTDFFKSKKECKCFNQSSPFGCGLENCCGYDPFVDNYTSNFECICKNQTLLIDPNGYNCCNITKNQDLQQCNCQRNFSDLLCCKYPEFSDRHECQCLSTNQTSATYPEDCCDYWKWENNHTCVCRLQNGTDPLNPKNCCDIYSDDINCQCQTHLNPIMNDSNPQNCCNATKFQNHLECLCASQDDPLSVPGRDCCQTDRFKDSHKCICRNRTYPLTQSFNCCDLDATNPQCVCLTQWNTTNCCKYLYFQDRRECQCLTQEDSPFSPEPCCDLYPWNQKDICKCQNQSTSLEPINCCSVPNSPFNTSNNHDCMCDSQTQMKVCNLGCCNITKFNNTRLCNCTNQVNSTSPLYCCDHPKFANDLECACINRHIHPIFYDENDTLKNCCTLASHRNDALCRCERRFNATKCCGYELFENRTECICISEYLDNEGTEDTDNDYNYTLPITECCNVDGFYNMTVCACNRNFTADPCCNYDDVYANRTECQCRNQSDPFNPTFCCNDSFWANNHSCLCYNVSDPTVVQSDGRDCCDEYPDDQNCICKYQLNPIVNTSSNNVSNCCYYGDFPAYNICICASQSAPLDPVDCCDYEDRFMNTDECLCRNVTMPYSETHLNCCSVYSDHPQCQCFQNFIAAECCGYEGFEDRHECLCLNNQSNSSHIPYDCCDQPPWSLNNDTWCVCNNQLADPEADPTTPQFCCDFNETVNASYACVCYYQIDPIDPITQNNCCESSYHNQSTICICSKQGTAFGEYGCCDYYPDDEGCYCANITANYSTGQYNCCELAEYQNNNTECSCLNSFNSSVCCDYDIFANYIECICQNPNLDSPIINSTANCCLIDPWTSDPRCLCQNQPLEEPDIDGNWDCCELNPWNTSSHTCLCRQQDTPINGTGYNCCDLWTNPSAYPECYCAALADPYSDQGCCSLAKYSCDERCFCNFVTTSAINGTYNCCTVSSPFIDLVPCLCYSDATFTTECCNITDDSIFNSSGDSRCNPDPIPPPYANCSVYIANKKPLPVSCCLEDEYQDLYNCPCLIQNVSVTTVANCCGTSRFLNDSYCTCASLSSPLDGPDCCNLTQFEDTFDCVCATSQYKIDNEQNPTLNCCNLTIYQDLPQCQCDYEWQTTQTVSDTDTCCGFPGFSTTWDCICASTTQVNATYPNPCCNSTKYANSDYCLCTNQYLVNNTFISPKNCCALSQYMSETECQCQSQSEALSPQDCCFTDLFQNNSVCRCKGSNFVLDEECCSVYPDNPGCDCLTIFTIPTCCQYNSSHPDCGPTPPICYPNDTYEIDFEEIVENYEVVSDTTTIVEGLIFFNPLLSSDNQTVHALNTSSTYDPFSIDGSSLTESGLSIFSTGCTGSNYVYSAELPWEGTFSVHLVINQSNSDSISQDTPLTIYLTAYFSVALYVNLQDNILTYTVTDASSTIVASVEVTVETPLSNWWPQLTGDDRTTYFANYIPQKVELGFEGRDCWLSIISINDQLFESEVWGCLVPDSATTIPEIATHNDVEIRNHFGAFILGSATNPDYVISISNVYMIAGSDESVGVLTPNVAVTPYDPEVQIDSADEAFCEVAFDWSRISLLPSSDGSGESPSTSCQIASSASSSAYGSFQTVQYSHSIRYLPPYQFCGTVDQASDDLALKSHICEQDSSLLVSSGAAVSVSATSISYLSITDFIVLSTNFEDYNPTFVHDTDGDDNIYLVADNEAGIRTVISPSISSSSVSDIYQVSFTIGFDVVSFPTVVLNANNADPTAEIVYNIRFFGQKTISVVFLVSTNEQGGPNTYQVVRKLEGAVFTNAVDNITTTTNSSILYSSTVQFIWSQQSFNATIYETINSDNGAYTTSNTYSDESSSEVEVSLQTFLSYGPTHGYFQPTEFIADRSAVFKVSSLSLQLIPESVTTPTL